MKINIIKASGTSKCRHADCEKKREFIKNGRIIKNTICAQIIVDCASGGAQIFYCRACLDKVYLHVKAALNSNLWVFQ